jgi:all-trans-8'-apo-beta-carotenal 15,15'-oxygenase
VTLYEFDEKFALIDRTLASLPGFAAISDFATTPNFAVFIQPAVKVNGMQFLLSKDPSKCLESQDKNEPGTLHLIPRSGSQKARVSLRLPAVGPSETNVHFVNAFEEGPCVIVDVILSDHRSKTTTSRKTWPWATSLPDYQAMASKTSLWRYTIQVMSGRVDKTLLLDDHCLFGTINPSVSSQKHRYIYANVGALGRAAAPPQGILRYDTETEDVQKWMPEPYEFCGEPMYAPRQGATTTITEDSGYIISLLYNGQSETSEVIILHASADLAAGPIARIPLNIAIPHGLFGCFVPSAVWPADSLERRAKLSNKIESRGSRWNEVKSDFSGLGLRLDDMEEYFGDFFN